jgi:tyrosine-protein kinase Etk/Wzc
MNNENLSNFQPEEQNLDIKRWFSLFMSNWYWFAVALFITISAAYFINRYAQKIYTVSSTMLIKDEKFSGNTVNIMPGAEMFKSQMTLNNEIGIIKSFSLNYRVMTELTNFHVVYVELGRRKVVESEMYNTCPFKIVYDSIANEPKEINISIKVISEREYLLSIDGDINFEKTLNFGERFAKYGFDFAIEPREKGKPVYIANRSNTYYFYFVDPGSLASEYKNKLSVTPINKDASIVTLSVSGPVYEKESDFLNKLMEVYIRFGLDNKNQTADSTIKFIDNQLLILSDSLKRAEDKLQKFRTNNKFIDVSSEGSIIQKKVEEAENEKNTFELQLQYYNYLSDYLKSKNAPGTIISPSALGISDPLLIAQISSLSELQKETGKIGLNISVDQPASLLLSRQMEEVHEALEENVRNSIANLKLLISESARKIAAIEVEISKLPDLERQLINIKRKVDLDNTVYTYLLEKSSETGIAKATNIPDNRIIDRASYFSSVLIKPTASKNLYFAFLMGLLIPVGLIVIIDLLNDKVIDKKDVERKTKIPVIGFIGHTGAINEIPVVKKPGSVLAESFRSVRTSLKYFVKENETAVISVSSTISSEGKTFFSVNLAAIVAMLGKKVLLIGLDLRKPGLNKIFDIPNDSGMSTYLSGNNGYDDIIKETGISNLYYAPSGPRPPNPAELIETDLMKAFIARAKQEFDFIIIDTPPLGLVTDALLLSDQVDVNLLIIRQRYTSKNSLEMLEQLRLQNELRNLVIVINDISLTGYYGYGMRYNYSQGYGYYYGHEYYGSNYYGGYGRAYGKRRTKTLKGYYTDD